MVFLISMLNSQIAEQAETMQDFTMAAELEKYGLEKKEESE